MTTVSETLYKAAELLGKNGHHKGSLFGPEGSMCAVGAICNATDALENEYTYITGRSTHLRAIDALELYVQNTYGLDATPEWNDAPSTSAEDVILTLKTLASLQEEK